jgi:hypothetical protein
LTISMHCRLKGKMAMLMMTPVSSGRIPPRRTARESNTEGTVALPASHNQIVRHVGVSRACPVSVDYAGVFVMTERVRGIIQSCAEL